MLTDGDRTDKARRSSLRLLLMVGMVNIPSFAFVLFTVTFCVPATRARKEISYVELLKRPGQTLGLIVSGAVNRTLQF
jgi:hypothetical protein